MRILFVVLLCVMSAGCSGLQVRPMTPECPADMVEAVERRAQAELELEHAKGERWAIAMSFFLAGVLAGGSAILSAK